MACRIRTIKPEILDDERSAGLSDTAWRLWVSMWLMADDAGRLRAADNLLASRTFWASQETPRPALSDLITELEHAGLIRRYAVDGQKYAEVCGWRKHQKIDRPTPSKIPPNPDSDGLRENLASLSASPNESTKTLATDLDLDLDRDRDRDREASEAGARELLAEVNAARKRVRPSSRQIAPTESNLKHLRERLAEGHTPDDVRHVIAVCEAECRHQPDAFRWFDAITPFRRDNFARKCAADPALVSSAASVMPTRGPVRSTESRPRLPDARDVIAKIRGGAE